MWCISRCVYALCGAVPVRLLGRRDGETNGGMCTGGGDWRDKQLPALYVDLIEKIRWTPRPLGLVVILSAAEESRLTLSAEKRQQPQGPTAPATHQMMHSKTRTH
ncbi:unnamed protein product [Vitrella brassicaformis CCMP3155]|uniref:Uncharacterized protein n=1 Tax=Vitrella brassicaformis (strain CCMP3155) TaxID=1169540 RepID=A0A0G4FXE4_VITBC|nr:unnamed protein product [Vitrella brassicaformis CCMP3155]|eukprot:CEM20077.1 unnamed protein product [Vitrella brassicaformis CCMP3155]